MHANPDAHPASLHDFARAILSAPGLDAKLAAPPPDLADAPAAPLHVDAPVRGPGLALSGGAPPLPRPGALAAPEARAACLARFAHHELMAVELFAWALVRWPALPAALRRGWLGILADEQRHCRLYLERLTAHGSSLSRHPCSGYFWRQADAIAAAPSGPRAFLAAMGLTLEQANLDFTLLYRDAFRAAGDAASARVCERVHEDEIRHVAFAREWLLRLDGEQEQEHGSGSASDVEAYRRAVPFPLSPARAKGRRFDAAARRRAGLSEALIETVRDARSSQQTRPPTPRSPGPRA
jgi:uncharacterized ferritin-like protein (DUF455 family)